MQVLLAFDEDNIADGYEYDLINEDLKALYNRMMDGFNGIMITGCLGLWDGPHDIMPVRAETFDDFMKMFDKDIRAFEISLVDEDTDVSELQRYSAQWKRSARKGSIVVKAWHHDGCNIFVLYPLKYKNRAVVGEYTAEGLEW